MSLQKAREALEKAIDELAKLHRDEERLVEALKPLANKPPTGTMAVVADKLYKDLQKVQKALQHARSEHDKAVVEMGREYDKHFAT